MMINKKVGELIRNIRKKHNVAMTDLANSIQISQPRLSRIENGEQDIPISVIEAFCNYFDMPLEAFIRALDDNESKSFVIDEQLTQVLSSLNEEQKTAMYTFIRSFGR